MSEITEGRRIEDDSTSFRLWDYWKEGDTWFAYCPAGVGSLGGHDVTEHEDRTITVSPSILVTGEDEWHGYLERGIWREV